MEIPIGIEGDYVETKKDHLFFDVKGLHHPNDRKICFLRFIPDVEGDRVRNGIRYTKIYNLEHRYSIINEKYPQYSFFSQEMDMNLQCVKNEDIKKIYSPRDYYKMVSSKQDLTKIEKISKELCNLFVEFGAIPENLIGITGSPMVGLNTKKSDIDIILYGTQTSLQFQEKIQNIFKKYTHIRKYNLDEYKKHYDWRVGGSDISFQDFLKSEQRKLHQGIYQGVEFFIRYIKSPRDWEGDYHDYQYKNMGRISLIAEIIDSTDSIFTPCSYKIKCSKVLESDANINNRMNVITQINSYRGRFCEQAKDGEKFLVKGKIEKVTYRDSEFYRILLTDQTLDKMIIID
ncbi:MAG: hypothetical protein KGD66_07165 [Candidatus Lokiarchaeota archaeon]|nr:hypothetical protein [Candidatus Lokiarchaeota archaeon]